MFKLDNSEIKGLGSNVQLFLSILRDCINTTYKLSITGGTGRDHRKGAALVLAGVLRGL